jgi:hypothetical protein
MVSPSMSTVGAPIRTGRDLLPRDDTGAPVVVSETFAARAFPASRRSDACCAETARGEIVGVAEYTPRQPVGSTGSRRLRSARPADQGNTWLALRTSRSGESVAKGPRASSDARPGGSDRRPPAERAHRRQRITRTIPRAADRQPGSLALLLAAVGITVSCPTPSRAARVTSASAWRSVNRADRCSRGTPVSG